MKLGSESHCQYLLTKRLRREEGIQSTSSPFIVRPPKRHLPVRHLLRRRRRLVEDPDGLGRDRTLLVQVVGHGRHAGGAGDGACR